MTPKLSASQASFFFFFSPCPFGVSKPGSTCSRNWKNGVQTQSGYFLYSLFFLDSPGKMLIGMLKVEIIQKNFFFSISLLMLFLFFRELLKKNSSSGDFKSVLGLE